MVLHHNQQRVVRPATPPLAKGAMLRHHARIGSRTRLIARKGLAVSRSRRGLDLALVALVAAALPGAVPQAQAQAQLEARYVATLAGIPVGRGAWFVDVGEDRYVAAASGMTTGLLRLFSSGEGTGAARGLVVNGRLAPTSYAASIVTDDSRDEVRMSLQHGAVSDLSVTPPVKPSPDRIAITEAHRRGITDPMTASLFRGRSKVEPLVPDACARSTAIFDGRLRYDMHYAFRRIATVKAAQGYAGPALVCGVRFQPIAGHIPTRVALRYVADLRDIELWLVPLAGTDLLVPFRLAVPTPIGLGVVEATRFEAQPHRAKARPTSAP